ncbi:MAG: site-specific DNA-methyltransferase [Oscillatoriales cyanobacterium]|nr:MAG: site-specific DNA-methyltransferase [Oscillatoriales cyanobacterium]TAE03752.1 MAG: site-specific DNA-methyltransferase [Oscillatoriales cyanobacterium]TAF03562.1 MAG: site-specific DNA-methyltransferase [Oscillatoriales cyanobacterium]TAF30310.1 MAG: site-specific DNA-methyltransferase [Oscillatoriales cyanobacterium]TAF65103.1 MAG: site-specific DNA-methyltransferase [Oscillatoriales cyanobacterium]
MVNQLFYGDNLEVLRRHIKDESVDLCYIDPPFNSKRNYNQIYNNIGKEDQAQAQAFIDTWTWDDYANQGLAEILENYQGKFTSQSIDLIAGLTKVLSKGSLLAYLVHMTLRVVEIYRVLKPTGSFYLHCDSTVSHYLKLVLDAIFCPQGGDFINEIVWKRTNAHSDTKQGRKAYGNITDAILYYTKSKHYKFNTHFLDYTQDYVEKFYKYVDADGRRYQLDNLTGPGGEAKGNPYYEVMGVKRYWRYSQENMNQLIVEGRVIQTKPGTVPRYKRYLDEMSGTPLQNIWDDIKPIQSQSAERLGYPTQKPLAILERIIQVSSDEGDVVLDAYCGCGTTVCASQRLNRQWIGIDITYQSISLILKRLEDSFGKGVLEQLKLNGIPKDMEAAVALANKKDDRTRKEFEKWAVLTYTNNRAIINAKKGADKGIDGIAYFQGDKDEPEKIIVQVKSGKVQSGDIRDLQGTITLEQAALGIFISLKEPTKDMIKTAKSAGIYQSKYMSQSSDKIQIVTIKDILEQKKRLDVRLSFEVVKSAEKQMEVKAKQLELDI